MLWTIAILFSVAGVVFMYWKRRNRLLQHYERMTDRVQQEIRQQADAPDDSSEAASLILVTPTLQERSLLHSSTVFMDQPCRTAFKAIAAAGELNATEWGVFWMVAIGFFKRTQLYGNTLTTRHIEPLLEKVIDRAIDYQVAAKIEAARAIYTGILLGIERDLPLIPWRVRAFWFGQPTLLEEVRERATALLEGLPINGNKPTALGDSSYFLHLFRLGYLLPWERKYFRVWKRLLG